MESSIRTKEDILRFIAENQARIRALGVRRIGLFGSFVRGEQQPESDIDLLVDFEPLRKTFDHFMELSFFLEEALQRHVELVTLESLSPHLKPHILAEVEYAALAA
ncbi:MAG TPA: nucleotidyltransferase family protein [Thermoanaerobaculia bacterium]|nr:nucleotidyltransferase family protein [Thermoanaerobaculia bacterium]